MRRKLISINSLTEGVQQRGTYRVDVMVNGKRVDTRDVVLERMGGNAFSGSLADGQSAFHATA